VTVTIDDSVLFWAGVSAASLVGAALYLRIARWWAYMAWLDEQRRYPNLREQDKDISRGFATCVGLLWPMTIAMYVVYFLLIRPVVPRG
jgi:hypothetical protein